MNVGGPAVQVSALMRGLPTDQFEHRLYTGYCAEDENDYLVTQAPDVDAFRVKGLGRALTPRDDSRALIHLMQEIRGFQPHIIHTHTAKAGVLGRIAAKVAGRRTSTVHTFHGHLLHGYFPPSKTRAVIAVERCLATMTNQLVAVGPRVRDQLLTAHIGKPHQYSVIPPGLTLPRGPAKNAARSHLGLPQNKIVIGFIGRLTGIKRPDIFVDVVRKIHSHRSDVHFVVAGDGDLASWLYGVAGDLPITMLGWRDDIETVLAACDAVLLTSENEGTPLSLIQAGMAGLPVVATAVGSVGDVVIDGETGWLTGFSADAVSHALFEMLAKPAECRKRGLAGKQHTADVFGLPRFIDDHAALYHHLRVGRS